jgi:hypothetical protein
MGKSIVDSSLLIAIAGALLYFSGFTYYYTFFAMLGIPLNEFLPSAQLLVAKSALILFELFRDYLWLLCLLLFELFISNWTRSRNMARYFKCILDRVQALHGQGQVC